MPNSRFNQTPAVSIVIDSTTKQDMNTTEFRRISVASNAIQTIDNEA
jgi:hypothetical protein